MKILYIAEIVGKTGIHAVKQGLGLQKELLKPDFTIACGDGATGGSGLGRNHAAYLRKLGIDALTTGECSFYKKDLTENLEKLPYVVRPDNLNPQAPGFGARVFKVKGEKIALAVLLGQSGFGRLHGDNPFARLPVLLERLKLETPYVILDFHAQATAEKATIFALGDGKCSGIIGSHTRVQTSDERILSGGSAVITDAGRTGSAASVGGSEIESRIKEYLTGIPEWTREAWEQPELQGVFLTLDNNGRAASIVRIKSAVEAPLADQKVPAGENLADMEEMGDD